jgi:hypothetical protein
MPWAASTNSMFFMASGTASAASSLWFLVQSCNASPSQAAGVRNDLENSKRKVNQQMFKKHSLVSGLAT